MQDDQFDAQLRSAMLAEQIDTTALDARILAQLNQAQMNRTRVQRGKWIAAVGIAALLAIAIGGYFALPHDAPRLCRDAEHDHGNEVVQHGRRLWLMDNGAIATLADKQGIIAPPQTLGSYQLKEGRLCRLDGRVFLHLVYSDGSHEASVYFRKRGPEVSHANLERENVALYESARFTIVAVSDPSQRNAAELARFAARMAS